MVASRMDVTALCDRKQGKHQQPQQVQQSQQSQQQALQMVKVISKAVVDGEDKVERSPGLPKQSEELQVQGELAKQKAELLMEIETDGLLTSGQREQVMRFLAYTPGKRRGKKASDPINRLTGVEIARNYLRIIKEYRKNLDELSERSFAGNRIPGGKSGIIRFRKKGSGRGRVGRSKKDIR